MHCSKDANFPQAFAWISDISKRLWLFVLSVCRMKYGHAHSSGPLGQGYSKCVLRAVLVGHLLMAHEEMGVQMRGCV